MMMLYLFLLLGFGGAEDNERNFDRFTYTDTVVYDKHTEFGPADWDNVMCPSLDLCVSNSRCLLVATNK